MALLRHSDRVVEKIDALPGERKQLSPSQAREGGHQDECPEPGLDRVSQGVNLRHRGDRLKLVVLRIDKADVNCL